MKGGKSKSGSLGCWIVINLTVPSLGLIGRSFIPLTSQTTPASTVITPHSMYICVHMIDSCILEIRTRSLIPDVEIQPNVI